eukprot:CAMPEP_0170482650 /NCGR_PEP_ID=MMETSP0208-20121228/2576_1 /TAXON_ID=197538 /ORGANISM="Strombidium inclinatum, Strain S3" /LENGTH=212 /DNA_ID=CAMNT_0010755509 /DNA_START=286 /DNA_END=924 /DNA_ORIENTATION=+
MTLLACPSAFDTCGAQVTTIADTTVAEATVDIGSGGIASGDGCVVTIKASCGAPYIKSAGIFDVSATGSTRTIMHYTKDSRLTMATSSDDTTSADFPATSNTCHDASGTDGCGTAANCNSPTTGNPKIAYRKDSETVTSTTEILALYTAYNTLKTDYMSNVSEAVAAYDWFDQLFSFLWFQVGPAYPNYIGEYTGLVWSDLTSLGAWGDLSV